MNLHVFPRYSATPKTLQPAQAESTRFRSDSGLLTHQEEHALLVALLGEFLEAALADEVSAGLHERVDADQVTLQLEQLLQVLLREGNTR